jgi:hypothetical protein
MTYATTDIVHSQANQVGAARALDVIAFGKHVALDTEMREMLPRVADVIGQRLATGAHATHELVASLCVMEAFGSDGTIDSGAYQRLCDIAYTLYAYTITLLTKTSRNN